MVSEMVEIFFSQYLANFETRGCGGDFSHSKFACDASFSRYLQKTLKFVHYFAFSTRQLCKSTFLRGGHVVAATPIRKLVRYWFSMLFGHTDRRVRSGHTDFHSAFS